MDAGGLVARILALLDELPAGDAPIPERAARRRGKQPQGEPLGNQPERAWHLLAVEEVRALVAARAGGLTSAEVAERRALFGPNALPIAEARSDLDILLSQLRSVPVALLGASAVLSAATGGIPDAIAIAVVVAANAAIGFYTERGAERTIASLERGGRMLAQVERAGSIVELDAEALVPGDVLLLGAGSRIPADARVLVSDMLSVDESALTGESMPVAKHEDARCDPRAPLAERANMVHRGTLVVTGTARCVVVAIGAGTEIGRVQTLVGGVERPETPLQRELGGLGVRLAIGAGVLCGGVFALGVLRGRGSLEMLRVAVSLGVAAVPEGLPTVAITTLALGIRRMQALNISVRQLSAVETMGSIQSMCLDKTGTITQNRMVVREVCLTRGPVAVSPSELPSATAGDADFEQLLRLIALCSEAELGVDAAGAPALHGSPTEMALLRLALDAGLPVSAVRAAHPRLRLHPRTAERSFMATVHAAPGSARHLLAVKGRPADVLAQCSAELADGRLVPLDDAARLRIQTDNERLAGRALRVLGYACGEIAGPESELAGDWVWVGLVGMADPPRPDVSQALARLHAAGIDTLMVTGDQAPTAFAVAKQIGLSRSSRLEILDASELDRMNPEMLRALAQRAQVFARVSPSHKLEIVRALQQAGRVVAMTGDGINDGPALKAADVGIAMGASGTAAAREVADVVLGDDGLGAIVAAVEQGRTIYADIKKAVHFILATNFSEILLTFAQVGLGGAQSLTPMQLLWINVMTDIFPELALAGEPPEGEVLALPPRRSGAAMFSPRDLARVGVDGALIAGAALAALAYGTARYGAGARAGTLSFVTLTSAQLLYAESARSEHHTMFDSTRLASNRYLPITIATSLGAQLLATFLPATRSLLGITRLGAGDWGVAASCALAPLVASETIKLLTRDANPAAPAPEPESTQEPASAT